jgi:hypothetical protein
MVVRLSTSPTGLIYLQEIHLVLISVRGWVNPRAIVQSEGFMSMKNSMTPADIKSRSLINTPTEYFIRLLQSCPKLLYGDHRYSLCALLVFTWNRSNSCSWLHCWESSPSSFIYATWKKINLCDARFNLWKVNIKMETQYHVMNMCATLNWLRI